MVSFLVYYAIFPRSWKREREREKQQERGERRKVDLKA